VSLKTNTLSVLPLLEDFSFGPLVAGLGKELRQHGREKVDRRVGQHHEQHGYGDKAEDEAACVE